MASWLAYIGIVLSPACQSGKGGVDHNAARQRRGHSKDKPGEDVVSPG